MKKQISLIYAKGKIFRTYEDQGALNIHTMTIEIQSTGVSRYNECFVQYYIIDKIIRRMHYSTLKMQGFSPLL